MPDKRGKAHMRVPETIDREERATSDSRHLDRTAGSAPGSSCLGEGAFNGVDLWYELRRARALVQAQTVPVHSGPERTLFNTLAGSGNLDKGVLHNDDLSIETDYLRIHGKGTLDLGTRAVDYSLVATLYKLPPEGAGSELADLKAADIPFTVRGSLDNLTVRPDLQELAKARVRQEVNKKLEEKKGELQKKLGEKLQDLFGR